MEIKPGYSYHIKDEFFDFVQDKYLMEIKKTAITDRIFWRFKITKMKNCIG